ncbi:hypothetical protein DB346_03535 [Verrucomicrobia bacterium LW23]|nr:hypothetical protein DB346_03535 [Verrucomicrobia bacterium LW23]
MRIAILVFAGVEELDFVGPWGVFKAAEALGAKLTVELVTLTSGIHVAANHGLMFHAGRPLRLGECASGTTAGAAGAAPDTPLPPDAPNAFDLLLLPGGAWITGGDTGVRAAVKDAALLDYLRRASEAGVVLASVCTGAFFLAEAGLLKGRRAATHHLAHGDLPRYGATLVTDRVVDDGNILSAGGVTSGLDLALWIVERFFGAELCRMTEEYLEYTPPRSQPIM